MLVKLSDKNGRLPFLVDAQEIKYNEMSNRIIILGLMNNYIIQNVYVEQYMVVMSSVNPDRVLDLTFKPAAVVVKG